MMKQIKFGVPCALTYRVVFEGCTFEKTGLEEEFELLAIIVELGVLGEQLLGQIGEDFVEFLVQAELVQLGFAGDISRTDADVEVEKIYDEFHCDEDTALRA